MNFDEIENIIGYRFSDRELLKKAFVHSSYAQEHNLKDNETMEFFGDAVLEFLSSEYLCAKHPDFDAGQLSKARQASCLRQDSKSPLKNWA